MQGGEAVRVRAALDGNGLTLSALAYYDNNLHPSSAERDAIHAHLRACIDTAAALGCPPVGTFIGRDPGRSVARRLRGEDRPGALGLLLAVIGFRSLAW